MKKFISLFIAAVMTAGVITGCASQSAETTEISETEEISGEETPADDVTINAVMLKGPTGIGAVELMEKSVNGEAKGNYSFELASAADEVTAKILNGEADIAAVPTNLASVLYNKTEGGVSVIALNTLGVLYVLENGENINSVSDLQGKTIYSSGQGAIPEYAFNYILERNGVTDTEIIYVAEHAEAAAALADGSADAAVLPEPNVTAVMMSNENIRIALDLTEEWNKISDNDLAMGCVIVRTDFLNEHQDAIENFLDEYEESISYVNENPEDAAVLVEKHGIMASAAAARKAIPNCNIVYIEGAEMQAILEGLYGVLYDAEPKSVGGAIPPVEFYYGVE